MSILERRSSTSILRARVRWRIGEAGQSEGLTAEMIQSKLVSAHDSSELTADFYDSLYVLGFVQECLCWLPRVAQPHRLKQDIRKSLDELARCTEQLGGAALLIMQPP